MAKPDINNDHFFYEGIKYSKEEVRKKLTPETGKACFFVGKKSRHDKLPYYEYYKGEGLAVGVNELTINRTTGWIRALLMWVEYGS